MTAKPVPYQLIIFDVDGTLIDSFALFTELLNNFSNKYGYEQIKGQRVEQLRALAPRQIRQALNLSLFSTLRLMYDCKKAMQQQQDMPMLFEGVAHLLEQLKDQGVLLAIVTSNSKENCLRYLGETLLPYFDWMECNASIYGKAKQIKKIIQRSGCALHEVIYIGDQIIDVQSAHKNKIRSAAVTWGFNTEAALRRQHPHIVVQTIAQLEALLLNKTVAHIA
jgi:phosphoglycolate phosphatase